MAIFRQCQSPWEKGLFNIDNYIEKRSNCKDMMVGIYHLNPSHISKNDQRTMIFEAKMGFFGRQSAVHHPFSWPIYSFFPRTNNFVSIGPNYKFFCVGCGFFQLKQPLNSPSSNSSFDHRQKIVMSAWGIWNIPKCRPTNTDRRPKIDRSSTGFFWATLTNQIRITLNIYRPFVEKWRTGGRDAMF